MEFHLDDMVCGGCVRGVTKAIQSIDPDAQIDADPETHLVKVQTTAPASRIADALREAGFPPRSE
ncbi:MAG: heavy-metal-associated domain-containing protein [Lautropia sp.]|nr:heavy-metal-associated domain-containing protein [Lautropia sp.]